VAASLGHRRGPGPGGRGSRGPAPGGDGAGLSELPPVTEARISRPGTWPARGRRDRGSSNGERATCAGNASVQRRLCRRCNRSLRCQWAGDRTSQRACRGSTLRGSLLLAPSPCAHCDRTRQLRIQNTRGQPPSWPLTTVVTPRTMRLFTFLYAGRACQERSRACQGRSPRSELVLATWMYCHVTLCAVQAVTGRTTSAPGLTACLRSARRAWHRP
jgi:hypothetical protein